MLVNHLKKLIRPSVYLVKFKHTKAHHHEQLYKYSYVSASSKVPLLSQTIGQQIEKAAELYENRDAFVDFTTGERVTFKELKEHAEDLASGLIAIGLNRGDRLGLWAPNCMEWILTQYATAMAGIILVNINPAYKTYELEYSLNKVGCKAIVMSETFKSQNYVHMLMDMCPELATCKPGSLNSKRVPSLKSAILIANHKPHDGFYQFEHVLDGGDSNHRFKLEHLKKEIQFSDPINIQYTSGTTGSPKGVALSHHMILNNANQLGDLQEFDKSRTIICLQAPLYHCLGMIMAGMTTITHGTTCVLPSPVYNAEASLKAIQQEKCTTLYGTPTMFIDLYNHPHFRDYDVSSLNSGVMAGSTCPMELVKHCVHKLNTKHIVVAYGLTEASPVITACSKHDTLENRTQTIGKVLDHLEVKVVDTEGRIVPVNEPGELQVRGYSTMIGYYGDADKTNETYTSDRFLKTGDIVKMDEHGYFHHMSRLKDMVIRGGENIYPKEIEDFLHKHPGVADVYVVGLPDERMGEELCACIKAAHGNKVTAAEIKAFCKDQIAHFKIPKYIEFMDEFPMTVTGKVQKNKLRELMTKKLLHH